MTRHDRAEAVVLGLVCTSIPGEGEEALSSEPVAAQEGAFQQAEAGPASHVHERSAGGDVGEAVVSDSACAESASVAAAAGAGGEGPGGRGGVHDSSGVRSAGAGGAGCAGKSGKDQNKGAGRGSKKQAARDSKNRRNLTGKKGENSLVGACAGCLCWPAHGPAPASSPWAYDTCDFGE